MVRQIELAQLPTLFDGGPKQLITRVSFEERSLSVSAALALGQRVATTAFVSTKRSESADKNLSIFRSRFPESSILALDTSDPLQTAVALYDEIKRISAATGLSNTVIDITAFRREELLMLVAILRLLNLPQNTAGELVYVGAQNMADWMSGQVTSFRSVIGYAGEIWPSRSTRLVVMMGFEFARAKSIIDNYEPKTLIIGKGRPADSITSGLSAKNDLFFEQLRASYDNIEGVFEFSARDPVVTAAELEQFIRLDEKSNVIIAPLHTKLSTVGAGLYAQRNKRVQICYAPVGTYNQQAYSTPGRHAYVLRLNELLA